MLSGMYIRSNIDTLVTCVSLKVLLLSRAMRLTEIVRMSCLKAAATGTSALMYHQLFSRQLKNTVSSSVLHWREQLTNETKREACQTLGTCSVSTGGKPHEGMCQGGGGEEGGGRQGERREILYLQVKAKDTSAPVRLECFLSTAFTCNNNVTHKLQTR